MTIFPFDEKKRFNKAKKGTVPSNSLSHPDYLDEPLPEVAITIDRIEYRPKDRIWKFPGINIPYHYFEWEKLEPYFDTDLIENTKKAAVKALEKRALSSIRTAFDKLVYLAETIFDVKFGTLSLITVSHVKVYRNTCNKTKRWHEADIRSLQVLLTIWLNSKLPGLDPKIKTYLNKTEMKSRPKNTNKRINDPNKGVFSALEQERIDQGIRDSFKDRTFELSDYILAVLTKMYGQRPSQFAVIKLKDFKKSKYNGQNRLCLNIPTGKGQGNQRIAAREEFLLPKPLPIDMEEIIKIYAAGVRKKYLELGEKTLEDLDELPLFPHWERESFIPGLMYHFCSQDLGVKLQNAFSKLHILSEVKGKEIKINFGRFRHTLATQYRAEGYSKAEVAAIMGWRSSQSINVYDEHMHLATEMSEDEAFAFALIHQAFKGKLKTKRNDGKPGAVKSPDLKIDHGDCDIKKSKCGLSIPYACFTCKSFEPWENVNLHMEFLRHLLQRRNNMLVKDTMGNAHINENRIATIYDLTIIACAEVINMCKGKQENGAS